MAERFQVSELNPGTIRAIQSSAPVELEVLNERQSKEAQADQKIIDDYMSGNKDYASTFRHFDEKAKTIDNVDDPRYYVLQQQVQQLDQAQQSYIDQELLSRYDAGEVGYDQVNTHFQNRFDNSPVGSPLQYEYLQQVRGLREGFQDTQDARKLADFEQGTISRDDYMTYLQTRQREESEFSRQYEDYLVRFREQGIEQAREELAQRHLGGDDLQAQFDDLKRLQGQYAAGSGVWRNLQEDINSVEEAIAQERYTRFIEEGQREYGQLQLDVQRREDEIYSKLESGELEPEEAGEWLRQLREERYQLAPPETEYSFGAFRSGQDLPEYTRSSRLRNLSQNLQRLPYQRDQGRERQFVQQWRGAGGRLPSRREILVGTYGLGRNLPAEQNYVRQWRGVGGRLPRRSDIIGGVYGPGGSYQPNFTGYGN